MDLGWRSSATVLLSDTYTTVATLTFDQVIWEFHGLPVVQATSHLTRIRFLNSFSQQDAILLDDIWFNQVPELSTLALAALGFVDLAACGRRRRNQWTHPRHI